VAQRATVPARARPVKPSARRFLPSARAVAIVFGGVVLAGGAYAAALETTVFSVRNIVIVGGTPRVKDELREALATELGRSLLRIGSSEIDRRVATIPDLVGVSYDRQFPHTLRVRVDAERPVLLLRRGRDTWLVSARGRVMQRLRTPKRSSLPRVWVPKGTAVELGATLPAADGGIAAAALAPITRHTFPTSVRFVRVSGSELTLVLHSGLQVRLGDLGDLRLKIAIAQRILHAVGADVSTSGYLDVSVPERPVVSATNSQVSSGA
jgi:cell division septal protein FtsQ